MNKTIGTPVAFIVFATDQPANWTNEIRLGNRGRAEDNTMLKKIGRPRASIRKNNTTNTVTSINYSPFLVRPKISRTRYSRDTG